ncbi:MULTISPECIES: hypothetical protein [Pseudomonas]|uniref:Uncharacterized protein n=1 Tax=Pseudomonas reactans TaxID=117680 RepID=A0A7Y8FYQ5_9PSED|nr:hypothetical protein [Pseudomonas reactans]NWE87950.1 hypothetical protein [Pseudomonas reactans]
MRKKSVFEDIVIIKNDTNLVGIDDIARGCKTPSGETHLSDGILLRPVAWSWFYLGEHVTTDRTKAEELLQFGENLKPLYTIVGEPYSKNARHDPNS